MKEAKEIYIGPITAELAYKKGFRQDTRWYWCNYYTGRPVNKWKKLTKDNLSLSWCEISAPTSSLLEEWLRINFKLYIWMSPYGLKGNMYHWEDITYGDETILCSHNPSMFKDINIAKEIALIFALNLLPDYEI